MTLLTVSIFPKLEQTITAISDVSIFSLNSDIIPASNKALFAAQIANLVAISLYFRPLFFIVSSGEKKNSFDSSISNFDKVDAELIFFR